MSPQPHDDTDLRRALHDAVADVEPRADLPSSTARGRAHWVPLTVAAALATVLALGGTAWLAQRGGSPDSQLDSDRGQVSVVAYAATLTEAGPRLVADRRTAPAESSDLETAVVQTVRGRVADGSYVRFWDPEDVRVTVQRTDGAVEVGIVDGSGRAAREAEPATLRLLPQAVAWTVATATGDPDLPVRLDLDPSTAEVLGDAAPEAAYTATRNPDLLAAVTVESVGQGQTVDSPFTVSGLATAFEGTVEWELRQSGRIVDSGFATAEECCTPSPYSFEVDAPPGDYDLRVAETDPSGGEGLPAYADRKAIVVR